MKHKDTLPEYIEWLKSGHAQALITAGALSAEVNIVDVGGSDLPVAEATYLFRNREDLQAYFDGPALVLREDGKTRWIDTDKISFSRKISVVSFVL
jgi:hypothetical protein